MTRAGIGLLLWLGVLFAGALEVRADEGKPDSKKASEPDAALEKELLELNRPLREATRQARLLAFVKDKARAAKAIALAVKMQKEAKGDKPFNFTASISLARAAQFVKENAAAQYFYEQARDKAVKIESGEKIILAYEGLIDLHWSAKQYRKVIEACMAFGNLRGPIEVERAKPFIIERLVQATAKIGDTDDAILLAERLIDSTDGGWYFTQLKGWVLREAGKHAEAIDVYKEVLTKLDTAKGLSARLRDQMKDQVRYILTGTYTDMGDIENAAKLLQDLIKSHPDNPGYKNDLGFIWANNDQKLAESEKLIREALDLDRKRQESLKKQGKLDEVKESSAYLDSLGWVLFKQKKLAEALTYLKKAATEEGTGAHLEIWDHLGDVHMALGQKKDALDAWQKALKMEDVSKRDVERRKKVIVKLKAAGSKPKQKATEDF